jgi:hypothetical protein
MRTVVTFESDAFNTREPRDYFINPGCFGDDLAKWLVTRLRSLGLKTDDEPDQEDFGWYLDFEVSKSPHTIVIGFRPADPPAEGTWVAWVERSAGLLSSLLGGRKRGIAPEAMSALHRALQSPEIRNVRWHERKDFDTHREDGAAPTPE